MANLQQAPKLYHNGAKNNKQFYQIPQDLADVIFQKLGNSSAQLRIMMVLIGTKEGFGISDKWICERTGLQHASYITARKALVKRGWITHEASKGITINYSAIYAENSSNTTLPQEEIKKECSNTVLPQRSNMVLPQGSNMVLPHRSNTVLPITYKETDNKTDNFTDSLEGFAAKQAANPSVKPVEEEKPKAPRLGSRENPYPMSRRWLENHCNDLRSCGEGIWMYGDNDYVVEKPVEEETFKF